MGLINKLFGRDKAARQSAPESSQFQESDDDSTTEQAGSKNAPRKELVQVVLRDTMRKHGIPSDWIECRILSVVTRRKVPGMHVHLVVRKGDDRLLTYVHAFQNSFLTEIERFEPQASDWLLSLAWQFEGNDLPDKPMPNPAAWTASNAAQKAEIEAAAAALLEGEEEDAALSEDLKALFAIRDAALTGAAPLEPDTEGGPGSDHTDFQPTQPGEDTRPGRRR